MTQLRTKSEAPHLPRPASAGQPSGSGRSREGSSGAGRCRAHPEPISVKGCGPGASRGGVSGARRGVLQRGPGTEEGQGERRLPEGTRGTRAAHSPLAEALAAPWCCGTRLPGRPSRPPAAAAAGLSLPACSEPSAPRGAQRRRVSGLRSRETPPPGSAAGAGREAAPRARGGGEAGAAPGRRPHGARTRARGRPSAGAEQSRRAPSPPPLPNPLQWLPACLRDAVREQSCAVPMLPKDALRVGSGGGGKGPSETTYPPQPSSYPRGPPPPRRNFPEPRDDHTLRRTPGRAHVSFFSGPGPNRPA